jgi:6,7-dimethyl-8-ribityllumazine synthase
MTSFDTLKKTQSKPSRIAVVQASWHRDIVERAVQSFITEITQLTDNTVEVFDVPGAYEIPLQAKLLANSGQYSAVVGVALVVDGGIYRHDFVAQAVVSGMMQVQIETMVPVFSVVLTPHHFQETDDHRNFFGEHFVKKGAEAAHSCAATLSLLETTRSLATAAK